MQQLQSIVDGGAYRSAMRAFLLICLLSIGAAGQEPSPLPEFSLLTLKGRTMTSQELKDSIVVLDFWATWCEGCVSEIPAFNRLEQKYSPRGVKVIGMAVQSGWARDIRRFAKLYKMRYTLLVGNDDVVSEYGVISFPATYVIAPGWKLHKKYLGVSATKAEDIQRDIEALLASKR
ncbi:MAG TPA: TlpA disulfide reductase family protein [Pyrinomonadaceae bacterium]|nr:TlpA disulfide reductase family protein [Pyrinomonadaceae bacterium]